MSLDLNKQKVLDLKKSKGIDGQLAQVVFLVDYSGSMSGLYRSWFVQKVLERLFPVAMAFDDNQSMDFILFQNDYHRCPEVTPQNLNGYVNNIALKQGYDMGGTSYSPALKDIIKPMIFEWGLFWMWEKVKKLDAPVYVIFLTDGDCNDKSDTYKVVSKLSHGGAFIQFIGIGHDGFQTLKNLDDMEWRFLDNADFFAVNDLDKLSDDQLYDRLMTEFPSWIAQARIKWLIK